MRLLRLRKAGLLFLFLCVLSKKHIIYTHNFRHCSVQSFDTGMGRTRGLGASSYLNVEMTRAAAGRSHLILNGPVSGWVSKFV